jgi:hypothetical protein
MSLFIRSFQYDDAQQVTTLIQAFWEKAKTTNEFPTEVVVDRNKFWASESKIRELAQDPNRQVFVAVDSNSKKIKGTVTLLSEKQKDGLGDIRTCFIDENLELDKQNEIYKVLLEKVEDAAKIIGIKKLISPCSPNDVKRFQTFGFTSAGPKEKVGDTVLPNIQMEKEI